jgi:hypothetical protein
MTVDTTEPSARGYVAEDNRHEIRDRKPWRPLLHAPSMAPATADRQSASARRPTAYGARTVRQARPREARAVVQLSAARHRLPEPVYSDVTTVDLNPGGVAVTAPSAPRSRSCGHGSTCRWPRAEEPARPSPTARWTCWTPSPRPPRGGRCRQDRQRPKRSARPGIDLGSVLSPSGSPASRPVTGRCSRRLRRVPRR